MSAINNGGPAFPWSPDGPNFRKYSGMTLRDWFAGQALAGLLANSQGNRELHEGNWALYAYTQADAMLSARNKQRELNEELGQLAEYKAALELATRSAVGQLKKNELLQAENAKLRDIAERAIDFLTNPPTRLTFQTLGERLRAELDQLMEGAK